MVVMVVWSYSPGIVVIVSSTVTIIAKIFVTHAGIVLVFCCGCATGAGSLDAAGIILPNDVGLGVAPM